MKMKRIQLKKELGKVVKFALNRFVGKKIEPLR